MKKDEKIDGYLNAIQDAYPGVEVRSSTLNEQGQYNDILILNDELIFRFPRYYPGVQALQIEAAILRAVVPRVSLPVPAPEYLQVDGRQPGTAFMGYRMLPGKPFWRELQSTVVDEMAVARIAAQLAAFLNELHHIPLETISETLFIQDDLSKWQQMAQEIHSMLFPFMRPEAQRQVSRLFDDFFADPFLHTFTPCLRHGDFGSGNFLFDPSTQSICGIIDFGSAGLGDLAADIAAASTMGERYFEKILAMYPQPPDVLRRAQFYRGTFALQDALHGYKNNDRSVFESGISSYR